MHPLPYGSARLFICTYKINSYFKVLFILYLPYCYSIIPFENKHFSHNFLPRIFSQENLHYSFVSFLVLMLNILEWVGRFSLFMIK
jgi:hypothetical protein